MFTVTSLATLTPTLVFFCTNFLPAAHAIIMKKKIAQILSYLTCFVFSKFL